MVSKEKLVDGTKDSILELVCDIRYGEHNILIYPDLPTFRDIYAHLAKARIENNNDKVLILPHYESAKSVQLALSELDLNPKQLVASNSLEIIDSHHAFFDPAQTFLEFVDGAVTSATRSNRLGSIIIADMGSFYHRQAMDLLIQHECKIPADMLEAKYTILCCYHRKDFGRLTKVQEERLCENHYRNLCVKEGES